MKDTDAPSYLNHLTSLETVVTSKKNRLVDLAWKGLENCLVNFVHESSSIGVQKKTLESKQNSNILPLSPGEIKDNCRFLNVWNKTWYRKAEDHVNTEKTWYVVDRTDKILGRMTSAIAVHIRAKNLPTYTPSVDMGAFVIVVNADKVAVSGKKRTQKLYRRHSGRPGGMKVETFD
ncbi:hypothetical protein L1887_10165 [Cichorium endivia]|nr:hypothetical protein L1887_10165 [Cichorium endivia]